MPARNCGEGTGGGAGVDRGRRRRIIAGLERQPRQSDPPPSRDLSTAMKPSFAKPELPKSGAVVVAVLEGRKLSPGAQMIDRAAGGAIARALASSRFKGKPDDALAVLAPAGLSASR